MVSGMFAIRQKFVTTLSIGGLSCFKATALQAEHTIRASCSPSDLASKGMRCGCTGQNCEAKNARNQDRLDIARAARTARIATETHAHPHPRTPNKVQVRTVSSFATFVTPGADQAVA